MSLTGPLPPEGCCGAPGRVRLELGHVNACQLHGLSEPAGQSSAASSLVGRGQGEEEAAATIAHSSNLKKADIRLEI